MRSAVALAMAVVLLGSGDWLTIVATISLVLLFARARRKFFLPIALLVVGDAATRRITEYGWRNELSLVFSKEELVSCVGGALAGRAAVLASASFMTGFEADGQINFLEPRDLLATSTLAADLASTHACVTRFGIGRAFHTEIASIGVRALTRWVHLCEFSSYSRAEGSSVADKSHLVQLAPPLRLLGGSESDMDVEAISPIKITADINARRLKKGYRGNCEFDGSEFKAMVRSWQSIDGSENLCCAHALLGIAERPGILDLYRSLIAQLDLLGAESTAGNDLRVQIEAHLTSGDMPTVTMFRRRHAQIQAALATYERTGRAPGIGQGQSLADSSYLGSFADHIALFSSDWGRGRCHLVVETWPGGKVNVQKWESIISLEDNSPMHRAVTKDELILLIHRYGTHLTCARMDHGSGLQSGYHHYAASYVLRDPNGGTAAATGAITEGRTAGEPAASEGAGGDFESGGASRTDAADSEDDDDTSRSSSGEYS